MSIIGTPDTLSPTDLKKVTQKVSDLFRAHDVSYDQSRDIIKAVRENLDLTPPERAKREKVRLSFEQQFQLIYAAYNLKGDKGIMGKTLFTGGYRVKAFTRIELVHFYPDQRFIAVHNAKNGKYREVPLLVEHTQELCTYVEQFLRRCHAEYKSKDRDSKRPKYLFESNRRTHYSPRAIQYFINSLAQMAGLPFSVSPHDLRRMIAIFLYEMGMSVNEIQLFLGHKRIETTQLYLEGHVKKIRSAYDVAMTKFFSTKGRFDENTPIGSSSIQS